MGTISKTTPRKHIPASHTRSKRKLSLPDLNVQLMPFIMYELQLDVLCLLGICKAQFCNVILLEPSEVAGAFSMCGQYWLVAMLHILDIKNQLYEQYWQLAMNFIYLISLYMFVRLLKIILGCLHCTAQPSHARFEF